MDNFILVKVDTKYCDYLREYDYRVSYNKGTKELRPFIGVIFMIGDIKYFAPLSSPKEKHLKMKNTIDFLKIKNGELGAINFNNMIPVLTTNYSLLDLDKSCKRKSDKLYNKLLQEQLLWLNSNKKQVKTKAIKLYQLYISNRLSDNIKNRCCNYKLLEEKCIEYNRVLV